MKEKKKSNSVYMSLLLGFKTKHWSVLLMVNYIS